MFSCSSTSHASFGTNIRKWRPDQEPLPDCPFIDSVTVRGTDFSRGLINPLGQWDNKHGTSRHTATMRVSDPTDHPALDEYNATISGKKDMQTRRLDYEKTLSAPCTSGRTRKDDSGFHGRISNQIQKLNDAPAGVNPPTHVVQQEEQQAKGLPGYRNVAGMKAFREV